MVAILQLLLIDIGIVDAVDVERPQRIIIRNFIGLVVLVAKRFEEIHVDDRGARRDDRVDHVRADELRIEIHATAGRGRARDHQDDRAILVLQHHVVDLRRPGEVAAGEAHMTHRVDDRPSVEPGDVDMLDGVRQQLCLAGVVDPVGVLSLDQGLGIHITDSVRAELVEALPLIDCKRKLQPFDKLRANVVGGRPYSFTTFERLGALAPYRLAIGSSSTMTDWVTPKPLNCVRIAQP